MKTVDPSHMVVALLATLAIGVGLGALVDGESAAVVFISLVAVGVAIAAGFRAFEQR